MQVYTLWDSYDDFEKGRSMKVFVAGASGRVGKMVVADLVAAGHQVVAASRHAADDEWPAGVTACAFDFHQDASAMVGALEGCDAIVFTAGSRGQDLLQTDAFGAVKLMQAAKQAGALRFVMLSSFRALDPEFWANEPSLAGITNYNIAKFFADDWLINRSGLQWTIVQPGVLTEEPGTGKIAVNPERGGENPIPDVAAMLAATLDLPNTIGKVIMMKSGDTPIADALAAL